MSLNFRTIALAITLLMVIGFTGYAQTVDEPNIGFIHNKIGDQQAAWGVTGGLPFEYGQFAGNVSTLGQGSGDYIRGKFHGEIGTDVSALFAKVYLDGTYQGPLGELGHEADVGLGVDFPEFDFMGMKATGGLGVFGRNAGAFGKVPLAEYAENGGYDATGLDNRTPVSTGFSYNFASGGSLNLALNLNLEHDSGVDIGVKLQPNIAGEGGHRLVVSPNTSVELGERVSLNFGADVLFQTESRELGGEIATQIATLTSVNLSF